MKISQFVEELLRRTKLSEIVSRKVYLRSSGTNYVGLCPFHHEKTGSFNVNDKKGVYHCFGCKASGNAITFLKTIDRLTTLEALNFLAGRAGMSLPALSSSPDQYELHKRLHEVVSFAAQWYHQQLMSKAGEEARNYLQSRGVNVATMESFRLGYSGKATPLYPALLKKGYTHDEAVASGLLGISSRTNQPYERFFQRLIFPILDEYDNFVGFGGRLISAGDNRSAKYINSPETDLFHKGKLLFNYNHARLSHSKEQPLVIVEGYMDVLSLHQAGWKSSVAPLGTAITPDQLQKAWRLVDEPVIMMDGDLAGQKAALKVALMSLEFLIPGKSLRFAKIPQDEDPDSMCRSGNIQLIESLVQQALPLIKFIWLYYFAQEAAYTPEKAAEVLLRIKELTKKIKDYNIQNYYYRTLYEWHKQRYQSHFRPVIKQDNQNSNKGYRPFTPPLLVNTNHSPNLSSLGLLREKFLIACCLRWPQIIPDISEELNSVKFVNLEMEALKQEIIDLSLKAPATSCDDFMPLLPEQYSMSYISEHLFCPAVITHGREVFRNNAQKQEIILFWRHQFELYTSHQPKLARQVERSVL